MNPNINISTLVSSVAAIAAAGLPDFPNIPVKNDSEDKPFKQANEFFRLYLTNFRDEAMAGLSYYAPQIGCEDDATEEQQVAAVLFAVEKFGAAGTISLINRSLAILGRQRASGKIGSYDDPATQASEYARHRSTNDGIVFTEEEAFNFVPGERERSSKWFQREIGKLETELATLPREKRDEKRQLAERILSMQEKMFAKFVEESKARSAALSVVVEDGE